MRRDVRPAPCLNPPVFRPEPANRAASSPTTPPSRVSVRTLSQGVIDAAAAQELDHPPSYVFANALAYVLARVLGRRLSLRSAEGKLVVCRGHRGEARLFQIGFVSRTKWFHRQPSRGLPAR